MRNDNVLLTGMNSASINKAEKAMKARSEAKKAKESKRSTLLPAIEPILALLDKEKERATLQMLELVDSKTSATDVKNNIQSIKMYRESIARLRSSLTAIMRVDK